MINTSNSGINAQESFASPANNSTSQAKPPVPSLSNPCGAPQIFNNNQLMPFQDFLAILRKSGQDKSGPGPMLNNANASQELSSGASASGLNQPPATFCLV